jgi:hypothetical protein
VREQREIKREIELIDDYRVRVFRVDRCRCRVLDARDDGDIGACIISRSP